MNVAMIDVTEPGGLPPPFKASVSDTERRLAIATEAADIGIWEWDIASDAMTYSPRAREICGFPRDTPLSLVDVSGIVHPEDYPRTSNMARRALDPEIRERQAYGYRI
jgi:PAS domain-containing protein